MRKLVLKWMAGVAISSLVVLNLARAQPVPGVDQQQDRSRPAVEQPRRADPLQSSLQKPAEREPSRGTDRRLPSMPSSPEPRLNYSSDEEQQPQ